MYQIIINLHGRVQGVCFRAYTQRMAQQLGLVGWVRNTEDGGVEVLAQGNTEKLEKLAEWAKKGPPAAHVTNINIEWGDAGGKLKDFRIKV